MHSVCFLSLLVIFINTLHAIAVEMGNPELQYMLYGSVYSKAMFFFLIQLGNYV